MKKEKKMEIIKEFIERNSNNKLMREVVEERGEEKLAEMLYDLYLNTDPELNDLLLDNLFYTNFANYDIYEEDKLVDELEVKERNGIEFTNKLNNNIDLFFDDFTSVVFAYDGIRYEIRRRN